MKFDKKVMLAGLIVPASMAITAHAAEPGFYIGAGAGESTLEASRTVGPLAPLGGAVGTINIDESDTAYKGFLGYQFLPWLGIEGGYVQLGSADKTSSVLSATVDGDLEVDGWEAFVVGTIPLSESFDLFGKVGGFSGEADFDSNVRFANGSVQSTSRTYEEDVMAYGAGAAWNFGDGHWSLRAEYTEYDTDEVDLSLISGSLVYRFFADAAAPAPTPVAEAPAPAACPDGDRDGVCDTDDQCPTTPTGHRVDALGCDCDFTLATHFAFDSAELTTEDMAELDRLAEVLSNPKLNYVVGTIDGYTDSVGNETYNENLSKKRAQAVANYLESKGLALGDRLTVNGYGEANPVADNDTEEGRAQNRRVTITRTDCGPTS